MARLGVSYQDVAAAAAELIGQDRRVTIENVRGILGTGSIGTINHHLRQWKAVHQLDKNNPGKDQIPEELLSLIKGLWERVCLQSIEQFKPIETNFVETIAALQVELEKYKSNNQRWQKLYDQWLAEKNKSALEKITLEQALDFAQKENVSLDAKYQGVLHQLQDKQTRIEELHHLQIQAQNNLEHYREAAREQRLLDEQRYEKNKSELLGELKLVNELSVTQQEKIIESRQENKMLIASLAQIENECTALRRELMTLEKTRDALTRSQNQVNQLQSKMSEQASELATFQHQHEQLVQQVKSDAQAIKMLQDNQQLLTQDKWTLAQEKAQLEGQLKLMQQMLESTTV